jgi:hypothetical protein
MIGNNNVEMDLYRLKKKLYLTLVSVNILEAIRFITGNHLDNLGIAFHKFALSKGK